MPRSSFMLICSIGTAVFISLICFFPEKYLGKIPSIMNIFIKDSKKESYKDYLPAIPKDPLTIWKLSQLECSLKFIEKKHENDFESKEKFSKEIILQAKQLLGSGQINSEILHKLPEFLESIGKNSFWSKIAGFFSFVNIIWMIAILGIIISVGPSLSYIFAPIMKIIFEIFGNIIYPIIVKLYEIGFFGVFGYLISVIIIADGMKVNKEYGFYISFTGVGLYFCLVFFHNYFKDRKVINIFNDSNDLNKDFIIKGILAAITFFSLSSYFNSKLFSFITVMCFYFLVGFYTECFGLYYVIGFKDKNAMHRVIITSFLLIAIFIIIRSFNIDNKLIELYRSPIQIFGALTYFLGLLINSSIFYYEIKLSYTLRQIIYIVSLIITLFFGNVYNLPSLTNTAYVFLVLYLMEKNVDFFMMIKGNIWVMIFILSLALWCFSLYLHKHPNIIISIFNGI